MKILRVFVNTDILNNNTQCVLQTMKLSMKILTVFVNNDILNNNTFIVFANNETMIKSITIFLKNKILNKNTGHNIECTEIQNFTLKYYRIFFKTFIVNFCSFSSCFPIIFETICRTNIKFVIFDTLNKGSTLLNFYPSARHWFRSAPANNISTLLRREPAAERFNLCVCRTYTQI